MGTLYIDRKGLHLKLNGNAIDFYLNGRKEGSAPVKPLNRVIIVGNVTVETGLLNRLFQEGITVIFLSGRRHLYTGQTTDTVHYNGLLRLNQYRKSLDRQFLLEFSRDLVRRKISRQADALKLLWHLPGRLHLEETLQQLEEISQKVESATSVDSVRGYEGVASQRYFSAYGRLLPPSLQFNGRNRRPPRDPVNSLLSLCYSLIYAEITTEIYIGGLDPVIGFYHTFEYGRYSLTCDIQELFRPPADIFVCNVFRQEHFRKRDFRIEPSGCYLKKEARSRFYPLYEEWARTLRREIRTEIQGLVRRILNGQNAVSEGI